MEAPARIKAENEKKERKAHEMVKGCTDCFRGERSRQKEKAREEGLGGKEGEGRGKTNRLPTPS